MSYKGIINDNISKFNNMQPGPSDLKDLCQLQFQRANEALVKPKSQNQNLFLVRKSLWTSIERRRERRWNNRVSWLHCLHWILMNLSKGVRLKVVIVFPKGKVETRSSFDDGIKSTIVNLARANLKAIANVVFKLPNIQVQGLRAFTRINEGDRCQWIRTYCQDSSESVLKGIHRLKWLFPLIRSLFTMPANYHAEERCLCVSFRWRFFSIVFSPVQ